MRNPLRIPFFEIGPKTYLYGKKAVALAVSAAQASQEFGVDVIFTAQYTDIRPIRDAAPQLRVYAQHMDPIYPGRGIGSVLPEALRDAGADGVMLNHAERPLPWKTLLDTVRRAQEVGLETIVCATDVEEALRIATLAPTVLLVENPLLIGTGVRAPEQVSEVAKINTRIHEIAPEIAILHGAGISNAQDVYEIILAGADATGSTSGIMTAADPAAMAYAMLQSVRRAWNKRMEEIK